MRNDSKNSKQGSRQIFEVGTRDFKYTVNFFDHQSSSNRLAISGAEVGQRHGCEFFRQRRGVLVYTLLLKEHMPTYISKTILVDR